jgi:hypothetical protein
MRKIEDEADARRCLAAVKASGGDGVAWANANGVDARSLNAWRVNLSRRDAQPPKLVELVPTTPCRPLARYAIAVGDLRVEFDDGFSGDTLFRVMQVLRSC